MASSSNTLLPPKIPNQKALDALLRKIFKLIPKERRGNTPFGKSLEIQPAQFHYQTYADILAEKDKYSAYVVCAFYEILLFIKEHNILDGNLWLNPLAVVKMTSYYSSIDEIYYPINLNIPLEITKISREQFELSCTKEESEKYHATIHAENADTVSIEFLDPEKNEESKKEAHRTTSGIPLIVDQRTHDLSILLLELIQNILDQKIDIKDNVLERYKIHTYAEIQHHIISQRLYHYYLQKIAAFEKNIKPQVDSLLKNIIFSSDHIDQNMDISHKINKLIEEINIIRSKIQTLFMNSPYLIEKIAELLKPTDDFIMAFNNQLITHKKYVKSKKPMPVPDEEEKEEKTSIYEPVAENPISDTESNGKKTCLSIITNSLWATTSYVKNSFNEYVITPLYKKNQPIESADIVEIKPEVSTATIIATTSKKSVTTEEKRAALPLIMPRKKSRFWEKLENTTAGTITGGIIGFFFGCVIAAVAFIIFPPAILLAPKIIGISTAIGATGSAAFNCVKNNNSMAVINKSTMISQSTHASIAGGSTRKSIGQVIQIKTSPKIECDEEKSINHSRNDSHFSPTLLLRSSVHEQSRVAPGR